MFRGRGYIYSALVLILDMLIGGWFGFMVATLTAVYAFLLESGMQRKIWSNFVQCEFQQPER